MKSTPAIKNIRKYKNAIEGRPKRVTTGVDDYGNRFHVVKGKVKSSLSKFGKTKKNAKLIKGTSTKIVYNDTRTLGAQVKSTRKEQRHSDSIERRKKLKNKAGRDFNLAAKHSRKQDYHAGRFETDAKFANDSAKIIHGNTRKSKKFSQTDRIL